jgi:hypothetical protein
MLGDRVERGVDVTVRMSEPREPRTRQTKAYAAAYCFNFRKSVAAAIRNCSAVCVLLPQLRWSTARMYWRSTSQSGRTAGEFGKAYLVIDPPIVPSPAFELPSVTVLDPAHFASHTIDDLILKLRAAPRPERWVADDEGQRFHGRGGTVGTGCRPRADTARLAATRNAARNVKIMDARSSSRLRTRSRSQNSCSS